MSDNGNKVNSHYLIDKLNNGYELKLVIGNSLIYPINEGYSIMIRIVDEEYGKYFHFYYEIFYKDFSINDIEKIFNVKSVNDLELENYINYIINRKIEILQKKKKYRTLNGSLKKQTELEFQLIERYMLNKKIKKIRRIIN